MNNFGDRLETDWKPPTEAELKVLKAKQERNNQISRLMGEYMLKGYKMLDLLCETCSTILLETRDSTIYCVACEELQSETSKDDPATSEKAAMATVQEQSNHDDDLYNLHLEEKSSVMGKFYPQETMTSKGLNFAPEQSATKKLDPKPFQTNTSSHSLTSTLKCDDIEILQDTTKTLIRKIKDLNAKFKSTDSASEITILCQAIKACAEAYIATKQVLS